MIWYNEFLTFNLLLIHYLIQLRFFIVVIKNLKSTAFSVDLPTTCIDFQIYSLTYDYRSLSFCIL